MEYLNYYIASAGDGFESIAYNVYGYSKYVTLLLNANPAYADVMRFCGGEEILLPEIKQNDYEVPIWKR